MARSKIAITIEQSLLGQLDRLIRSKVFPNRSQAIQSALEEKLNRLNHRRLAVECSKLDPKYEKALAEEGLSEDLTEWPEY
jgi:metal-responsive CopG/Arc/MetJ family transcriptional regulator